MRVILNLILLLCITSTNTYSSSIVLNAQKQISQTEYCEVTAQYKKTIHKNISQIRKKDLKNQNITKVYWQFQINSTQAFGNSACPIQSVFELFLPMVEHTVLPNGNHSDVYPDFVTIPKEENNYILKLKKVHFNESEFKSEYDNFILINWREGIEAI